MSKKYPVHKYKRTKILVPQSFQLRFAFYLAGILLASFCVAAASFHFGIWDGVADVLKDGKFCEDFLSLQKADEPWLYTAEDDQLMVSKQADKISLNQREMVGKIVRSVHVKLLPAWGILIVAAVWLSIFLTHKVAGPIYRMAKDLRAVEEGDLRTRIHLRNKDEGHALAEAVNGALASFDMTITGFKRIVRKYESDPEKMKAILKEELSRLKTTGE